MLIGQGTVLQAADYAAQGFDFSGNQYYIDHLKTDNNGAYGTLWKGPYLTVVDVDPWGNAYITNASNFNDNPPSPVWAISAGPNGKLETSASAETLGNDDIGVRIK